MGFIQIFKKTINNQEEILKLRFKSATFCLVFTSFLFFLNWFFVGAHFYYDFFIQTLTYTYILLLFGLFYFFLFFFRKVFGRLGYLFLVPISILLFFSSFLFIYGDNSLLNLLSK